MFDPAKDADITGRWTLLDPYYRKSAETGHSDPASGFAAMLLENSTYGKVLAIAGTEPGGPGQTAADLVEADVREIGFWGVAFGQVIALFNYVQELRAPAGQAVLHLTLHEGLVPGSTDAAFVPYLAVNASSHDVGAWLWLKSDMSGTGKEKIKSDEKLTVTGHSLGGHLAAVAVALFPDLFTEAVTFNAPGFNPPSSRVNFPLGGADQLLDMLRPYGAQPISVESIAARVHTLESEDVLSDDDFDVIAGNVTGQPFSPEHYISTEKVSHDVGHMLDSLALQAFMARLNPSLRDLDTGAMLDALSGPSNAVLETAVEKLYLQLMGSAITLDRTTAGLVDAGDFSIRSQLFDRLIEMQNQLPNLPKAHLYSLVSLPPDALKSLAEDAGPSGLGYRYALEQLNPFAVIDGHLSSDTKNRLALYDPLTGTGQITQQWLTDRAELLHWKLELGLIDRVTSADDPSYISNGRSLWLEDRTSEQTLYLGALSEAPHIVFGRDDYDDIMLTGARGGRLYGGAGNDQLTGLSGDDYLEGGADNDDITGRAGADTLIGMDGNDEFNGGTGNDLLEGGRGEDFYRFTTGDGFDQVFDVDGNNHILINSAAAPVGKQVGSNTNVWASEDGSVRFTLSDKDNGKQSLLISYGNGDRILIEDYKAGAFGLTLNDYQAPAAIEPGELKKIEGDLNPIDIDPVEPDVQVDYDDLNNVLIQAGVAEAGREDTLYDSAGNDELLGLGGKDRLIGGRGGNDKLDGGTDDDYLHAGAGNDTLIGGLGSDRLLASKGKDQLFANQPQTLSEATQPSSSTLPGARGDWLDGGEDDDLLIGFKDADVLLGGAGSDTLVGGDGNDLLGGDDSTDWLTADWAITRREVPLSATATSYRNDISSASILIAPDAGADVLYGGAGDDAMGGGGGNDLLDGGIGNDIMAGDAGSDTLTGGAGNDILLGDNLDWAGGVISALHGNDVLEGGEGNDLIIGNGGNDMLLGGAGNDVLEGDDSNLDGVYHDAVHYHGNDYLDGGSGNDTLRGGGRDDSLYGGEGHDLLQGDYADMLTEYQGADLLDGGADNDTLQGMGGADTLIGGSGDDQLEGDALQSDAAKNGNDLLRGDAGNDSLWGGGGADTLYGGADNDYLEGDYASQPALHQGADYLDGGLGSDTLVGDGGNDTLLGGGGDDYLIGGSGNNLLDGGSGKDALAAGTGNDRYVFGSGYGLDTIVDDGGQNRIQFGAGFSQAELRADVIQISGQSVLRLFNGTGDALLIFDYQGWSQSSFRFADGSELSFALLMKRVTTPVNASGTPQADALYGSNLNDSLVGGAGDDLLAGQGGADRLNGGAGNDTYLFEAGDGADLISDSEGDNVIRFAAGIDRASLTFTQAYTSSGNHVLQVQYQGGSIAIMGGAFAAVAQFEFADGSTLPLAQAMEGFSGLRLSADDSGQHFYGSNAADTLLGGSGNDSIEAQGGDDQLRGGAGSDYLSGGAGNDLLYGNLGNDHLLGGLGDDSLIGGAGNDTLEGQEGQNSYSFQAGMGRDEIVTSANATSILKFADSINMQDISARRDGDDLIVEYRYADDGVTIKDYYQNTSQWTAQYGDAVQDIQVLLSTTPGTEQDTVTLYERKFQQGIIDSFANSLARYGARGNKYELDEQGRYVLRYSVEIDGNVTDYIDIQSMHFEAGALEAAPNWMDWNGDERAVLLNYSSSHDIKEIIKSVKSFEFSSTGISPSSPSLGDPVFYRAGSGGFSFTLGDTVIETHDTYGNINGWLVYPPRSSLDGVTHNSVFKTDTRETSEVYKVVIGNDDGGLTNIEHGNIFYAGAGNDLLRARSYASDGYYHANTYKHGYLSRDRTWGTMLSGGEGNDTVVGSINNDFILGGAGDDILYGGHGVDTYIVTDTGGNDVIADFIEPNIFHQDEMREIIEGPLYDSYSIAGQDIVVLPNGVSVDQLKLSFGSTVARGVHLDLMASRDEAFLSRVNWADMLYATLDISWSTDQRIQVVLPHANDPIGTGIELFRFADGTTLTLAHMLSHAGLGRTPDPYLLGGVVIGDDFSDAVAGGAGNDTVIGSGALYGWAGNDQLIGGEFDDRLDGGLGHDSLSGNAGNDRYVVDNAADVVTEQADEGVDTVVSSISYRLGLNTENLYLVGSAAINGTGNAANNKLSGNVTDNILKGNAGDDFLYGGEGNDSLDGGVGLDTLWGAKGNDTYVVDNAADLVTELADEGMDTVKSSISYSLSDNIEKLILLGAAAINGTGNAENNSLYGNVVANILTGATGDDFLDGKAGADTLIGGIGNDTYVVDNTSDLVIESAAEGTDTVKASVSYSLTANVENLTLTGTAEINATGNELANTLKGNVAASILSGGLGNDSLYGGLGNDTYLFARGDGFDKVTDTDSTAGNHDTLIFSDVNHDQLWFRTTGNHLEVSVIGTGDKVSISNWSLGADNHVEQILASDGLALNDAQVANLVNAMAAFAAPAAGQTSLPANYHSALDTVIAANWH